MTFDAAHRLPEYDGKCKNLHGHTYKVIATVCKGTLNQGMVIDFGILKMELKKILEKFDHATILSSSDDELFRHLYNLGNEVVLLPEDQPTAEVMSRYIYNILSSQLNTQSLIVKEVTVYETPTNWATFG